MGFLITLFHRKEKTSASAAKDRLLEVLIHDRVKVTPATMEQIRREIIAVISKYIDVDQEGMEVTLTRAEGSHQLTANIPIRRGELFDRLAPDDDSNLNGALQEAKDHGAGARASSQGRGAAPAASRPVASTPLEDAPPRRAPGGSPSHPPQHFGPAKKKRH